MERVLPGGPPSNPKPLGLSSGPDLAAGLGFTRTCHFPSLSLSFFICEKDTVVPSAYVAGGIEEASTVLYSSTLGVANEKSARAQPTHGSTLLWGSFPVISGAHVLVLSHSPGVIHTSTNASFISEVTKMPQAGGEPRRSR